MRRLSDRELVKVWESGRRRPAWFRALLPLSAALRLSVSELADWPLGRRDGWLLALRAWMLGPTLGGVARCPAENCGQEVEINVAVDALLDAWPADDAPEFVELEDGGWSLTLRLPASRDFASPDADELSADGLLARCVVRLCREGVGEVDVASLPRGLVQAAEAALAEADPLALIEIALTCPSCGKSWNEPLNVAEYFWSELGEAARTLLLDVHVLATAYGWSEREVLGLGRRRRRLYRNLIDTQARPR
jgi:hypothetical protein